MEIPIKNRNGQEVLCRIDWPKNKAKSNPAVLVVHGFKGNSAQRHIETIAASLCEAGFVTLRPDLSNNPGKSYLELNIEHPVFDIRSVR